jgi:hypothetical protein
MGNYNVGYPIIHVYNINFLLLNSNSNSVTYGISQNNIKSIQKGNELEFIGESTTLPTNSQFKVQIIGNWGNLADKHSVTRYYCTFWPSSTTDSCDGNSQYQVLTNP